MVVALLLESLQGERVNKRYGLPLQSLSLIEVIGLLNFMDFISVLSLLLTIGLTA